MSTAYSSIFAGTDLAARIERAESELMAQCTAPHPDDPRTAENFAIELGGGFATFDGQDSPFTKVSGLGFDVLPGPQELAEVERRFAAHDVRPQFEISQLGDPELAASLTRRGYQLVTFENVLGRRLEDNPVAAPTADIEVTRGEDRAHAWMNVVVEGSLAPDTIGVVQHETFPAEQIERAEAALVRAGNRAYLATLAGAVAGGGGLRVSGGIAQLTGAATAPKHRRRGVQTALVHARLIDAREEGCDLAVVTCQPGSVSHANMQKLGFDLLYTRAVLLGPDHAGSTQAATPSLSL